MREGSGHQRGLISHSHPWFESKSRYQNAPMTELVYVLVLEAKFCEFESRLGHQYFGDVAQR
jgi:hypothetical protein